MKALNNTTTVTTLGGTLASVFANIRTEDFTKTVVLSAIGAVVSFLLSLALKWLTRKMSPKQRGS